MSNEADDNPSLERHFKGHQGGITAASFNPNMKQLVTSSLDSTLMVWNFRKETRAYRFKGHVGAVMDVCFAPNGRLIASASKDRTVRLWVPTLQGGVGDFKAHSGTVRSVQFSADSTQLVTASDDKSVKLWSVADKRFIISLIGHTHWVRCARFAPDNNIVGSCSDDKSIKLFDVRTGKCVNTFLETKGFAVNLEFLPEGSCVGTAMTNGVIKIYDIRTFKLLQHYSAHSQGVNKVSFHPNGHFLMSASDDGEMKVIDLLEGHPLYSIQGHEEGTGIKAVAFSKTGEYFASGGEDEQVLVWHTNFDQEKFLKETSRAVREETDLGGHLEKGHKVNARSEVKTSGSPGIVVTNVESSDSLGGGDGTDTQNAHASHECCCQGSCSENRNETLQAVTEALVIQVEVLRKMCEVIMKQQDETEKKVTALANRMTCIDISDLQIEHSSNENGN